MATLDGNHDQVVPFQQPVLCLHKSGCRLSSWHQSHSNTSANSPTVSSEMKHSLSIVLFALIAATSLAAGKFWNKAAKKMHCLPRSKYIHASESKYKLPQRYPWHPWDTEKGSWYNQRFLEWGDTIEPKKIVTVRMRWYLWAKNKKCHSSYTVSM